MPQVRAIVRAAAKDDYRFSALVAGVVASDAFRMQALPHDADRAARSKPPRAKRRRPACV